MGFLKLYKTLLAIGLTLTLAECQPEPRVTTEVEETKASDAIAVTLSVRDGVFTTTQAKRGAKVFEQSCLECHQPEQFTGAGFLDAWSGQTVYALFELTFTTMPYENPGRLKKEDCVDVLAYILNLNDLPAGKTDMPSDAEKLKQIRIEGLPKGRNNK